MEQCCEDRSAAWSRSQCTRHGFKDALRRAGVSEDLNDALTGHSGGGVGRSYGAKEMERRFGLRALSEAVAKVHYRGLDLSHVHVPNAASLVFNHATETEMQA